MKPTAKEKPKPIRTGSTVKTSPTQAPHGALPVPPLSPKAARLYHDFLEITVADSYGGLKALRCLHKLARARSANLSRGWAIRWGTLHNMIKVLEDARRSLHPYNQKRPAKAA